MESLESKYEIYKSDKSNDEIIKIIDEALRGKMYKYLIDIPIEWKRTFIGVINEHFKKGNENPFKSLAASISAKDSDLGFNFLCYWYSYFECIIASTKKPERFNKLKDENKIDFEAICEIEFDFDMLLNFYRNFKFKGLKFKRLKGVGINQVNDIYHIFRLHLPRENIYNTFLNVLKNNIHPLDNELLNIMYIAAYNERYSGEQAKEIFGSYLKENQKIDFEFLALAYGTFCLDEATENKLMEHFDFEEYKCSVYFCGDEKDDVKSLISNYLKAQKDKDPKSFKQNIKQPKEELEYIANKVKNIKKVTPKYLKVIKNRLYNIIGALPIDKDKKDKLNKDVRNIKSLTEKEFVIEVLKAIGEILLIVPAILGERRGFRRLKALNPKNQILPVVNEIKKPLDGRDLT